MSKVISYLNNDSINPLIELDLDELLGIGIERKRFESKWESFYKSDDTHANIFVRNSNNIITYQTEAFIPKKIPKNRTPLLFLAGNPASSSVHHGICFAYEGNNSEHRFWKALRKLKIFNIEQVSLNPNGYTDQLTIKSIREKLLGVEYDSKFVIGIDMYFTFPSTASNPKWSGVNGLFRLFGSRAMKIIEMQEQLRIERTIREFFLKKGLIVALQKNAYQGMKVKNGEDYSIKKAKNGNLISKCRYKENIPVISSAPTRFFHSPRIIEKLSRAIERETCKLVSDLVPIYP